MALVTSGMLFDIQIFSLNWDFRFLRYSGPPLLYVCIWWDGCILCVFVGPLPIVVHWLCSSLGCNYITRRTSILVCHGVNIIPPVVRCEMPVSASISSIEFRIIFLFCMGPPSIVCFAPVSSSTSSPVPIVIASMFSLQELEENSGWCFFWQCKLFKRTSKKWGVRLRHPLSGCYSGVWHLHRMTAFYSTDLGVIIFTAGRECDVKKTQTPQIH